MSHLNELGQDISLTCPHCGSEFDIEELSVSVTVENYDIARPVWEGVSSHVCDCCNQEVKTTAQLDVFVEDVK